MDTTKIISKPIYFIPTRNYIENLKVGDQALDCFGHMAKVVEISTRKNDVSGKLFVCYYTSDSDKGSSQTSMSMKEGELVRTVQLSCLHKSVELDSIERRMTGI